MLSIGLTWWYVFFLMLFVGAKYHMTDADFVQLTRKDDPTI